MDGFPQEVIELILDNALPPIYPQRNEPGGPDTTSERTMLSNFALVAGRWRHFANMRRFSSLEVNSNTPTPRVARLAVIMTTNVWTEHEDVAHHCHEFSLSPDDQNRINAQSFHEYCWRNAHLVTIIERLFRGDMRPKDGQKKIETKFLLGSLYPGDNKGIQFMLPNLHHGLIKSLNSVIANPNLMILHISNMLQVPVTMVCHPNIYKLYLDNVVFSDILLDLHAFNGWPLPHLRVLRIDRAMGLVVDLSLICDHLLSLEHLILANLKEEDDEILTMLLRLGKFLKKLTVEYNDSHHVHVGPYMIDFTKFEALSALHIIVKIDEDIVIMKDWAEGSINSTMFIPLLNYLPMTLPTKLQLTVRCDILWQSLFRREDVNEGLDCICHEIENETLLGELQDRLYGLPSSYIEVDLELMLRPVTESNRHNLLGLRSFCEYAEELIQEQLDYYHQNDQICFEVFVNVLHVPGDIIDDGSSDSDDESHDSGDENNVADSDGFTDSDSEDEENSDNNTEDGANIVAMVFR